MLNSLFRSERSTYHKTMVRKVHAYLKKNYSVADFERSLVTDRITDAFAYDNKTKTWYLCEIKVNWGDLQKALYQIHDTVFRFKRTHKSSIVIPVIAFPARLQRELVKSDNWGSFRDSCKNNGVAIWIIEQSFVRQLQSSNIQKSKATSAKKVFTKASAVKKTAAKKTIAKKPIVKASAVRKTAVKKPIVKASAVKKTANKKTVTKKLGKKKASKRG